MARYGKKAAIKVRKAMKERKRGTLRPLRQKGDKPQAGDCYRVVAGAPGGRQGAEPPDAVAQEVDRAQRQIAQELTWP
jgi:hypothetical protein